MSSRVTVVPAAQYPLLADPSSQASVNAPATTTSPFTTAVLRIEASPQLVVPNHCWHTVELVVPANTFGVQDTGVVDSEPGSGAFALAGATPNVIKTALKAEASNA